MVIQVEIYFVTSATLNGIWRIVTYQIYNNNNNNSDRMVIS